MRPNPDPSGPGAKRRTVPGIAPKQQPRETTVYTLTTTGSEQDIRGLAATLLGNADAGDAQLRELTQLYLSTRRLLGYLVDCMGLDADDDEPADIDVHAVAEAARQHRTFVDEFVRLDTPAK